jgi:hypothetical protein
MRSLSISTQLIQFGNKTLFPCNGEETEQSMSTHNNRNQSAKFYSFTAKQSICVGICASITSLSHANLIPFSDDFNSENGGIGSVLRYTGFAQWDITSGNVDLIIDGHGNPPTPQLFGDGMFLDMVGTDTHNGEITTKDSFDFEPGITYTLKFDLSGNPRAGAANQESVSVAVGTIYQEIFSLNASDPWQTITRSFTVGTTTSEKLSFSGTGTAMNLGMLLDNVNLVPEPGTFAITAIGFFLLALTRKCPPFSSKHLS